MCNAVWLAAPSMDFDRPQFNEDEVVALVKRDLIGQGLSSHTIASSNDYSAIRYLGDGKWRGMCIVYYEPEIPPDLSFPIRGLARPFRASIEWQFYENLGIAEIE